MAWPRHNKLVVQGSWGTSLETWSYSLKFKSVFGGGASDIGPDDWSGDDVSAAIVAFHAAGWSNPAARLTGWNGYSMDTTNHADLNNMRHHQWQPAVQPPQGGIIHPFQCALVVGLESTDRSARAPGGKDPARFGRVYLPGPGFGIQEDGRFPASQAMLVATAFKTFVEALKDAMYPPTSTDEDLMLVSPFPQGSPAGTQKRVDLYRVGRVVDTMQSRRRQLVEDYQRVTA